MASFPPNNDVVTQILLHLPLRTLFRFRKVCKSWAHIIHSPHFQKSHVLHHDNNNDNEDDTQVLVHFYYTRFDRDRNIPDKSIMLLDTGKPFFPGLRRRQLNRLKTTAPGRIVTETTDVGFYDVVTGPVNGLVCIYTRTPNGDITVCNPSLGQTRKLPPHPAACPNHRHPCYVAIGYDDVKHDYKVVRLLPCDEHGGLHASVYSRSRDSWRELAGNGEYLRIEEAIKSTSRDGAAAHWRARRYTGRMFEDVILSLDVKNEVFRSFEVPDYKKLPPYGVSEMVAKGETFVLLISDYRWRINVYEARFEGEENSIVRWDFVKRVVGGGGVGVPQGLWRSDCVLYYSWNQMVIRPSGWYGFVNDPRSQVDYYDPWGLNIHDFNPYLVKRQYRSRLEFYHKTRNFDVPDWCYSCQGFEYQGSFVSP